MTLKKEVKKTLKEAGSTSFTLFKIMIPISIIVKILAYFGLIEIIGSTLNPVMQFVGLPGDFGLVWATAMITNLYGGIIVLSNLAAINTYTIAQVSILAIMMLVAHNLPIELRIAQKTGVKVWFSLLLRVTMALLFGWILFFIFSTLNIFKEDAKIIFAPPESEPTIINWFIGEARTYLIIFLIILALVTLMRILKITGLINKLNNLLEPGLKLLGMSKNAAPVTIIGMTMGLAYGGGLIIKEVEKGIISKKDVFLSISLMNLSHSLIEDTLLMLAIGASVLAVLFYRVAFSIFIIILLIQVIRHLSKKSVKKYLVK
jgi:hypothetical protein